MAILVVPIAAVAVASGERGQTERPDRSLWLVAGAGLVPLVAIAGPVPVVVLAVALVAGTIVGSAGPISLRRTLAVLGPPVAAACLVLACRQGFDEALVLTGAITFFDMANYLVGTGRSGGILGALAGMVTDGVLAVFVAAVLVPPFTGRSPWILVGLVAVLAPAGVLLGRWLAGGRRLPALARLDSLLLAGPAWVIGVAVLLHR
jgi:hypothetical protein